MQHLETILNDAYNVHLERAATSADTVLARRSEAADATSAVEAGQADAAATLASNEGLRSLGALEALEQIADARGLVLVQDRRRVLSEVGIR